MVAQRSRRRQELVQVFARNGHLSRILEQLWLRWGATKQPKPHHGAVRAALTAHPPDTRDMPAPKEGEGHAQSQVRLARPIRCVQKG